VTDWIPSADFADASLASLHDGWADPASVPVPKDVTMPYEVTGGYDRKGEGMEKTWSLCFPGCCLSCVCVCVCHGKLVPIHPLPL
jgi:hypothetical protein